MSNKNPGRGHELSHDAEINSDAEREELVSRRRARQARGSRRKDAKLVMALVLLGGSLLLFVTIAGPRAALQIFGFIREDASQKTSQVDLKVDSKSDQGPRLDFIVPGAPEPVKATNGFDEKFNSLQDQLSRMARDKQPGGSLTDIQKLLDSYNQNITRKMESERKAMAEEVARLRADAEAEKLKNAGLKEQDDLNQKQRESSTIIVDEGSGPFGSISVTDGNSGANPQDLNSNQRFLNTAASSAVQTSFSQNLTHPSRTVVQGTIISAVLETAINTELPGNIRAQVMQPVYSFDGMQVLMPSGTILIGQFNNDVDIAQKRVLIAWNRAITPDGKSITLGSIGTDTLGRSGTLGNVDNRYTTKFGAAVLISAITAAPNMIANRGSSGDRSGSGATINVGGGGNRLGSSVGNAASDQGSDMLQKYLSLPPVIRIPQGEEIRIFANRDLVFL